jgi:hypothetical protein
MGAARLVRIGSPYNGVELDEIDFEQSADTMYMAHIDHAPTKLLRHAHDSWEFATIAFGPANTPPSGLAATAHVPNTDADNAGDAYFPQSASYVVTAIDDETGQESRASAAASATNDLTLKRNYNALSWTAPAGGADRYRLFKADNQQNYGYIGTTTGTSFTDDNIGPDLSDGPPVGDNPFAAAGSYPSAVTFFEQRLMWARTRDFPNAVYGSKSGDYENMDISRPLKADDALSFGLVAGRVNAANQMVSLEDLLVLTSDSIFKVNGGSQSDYLSASQIVSRRQLGRGASRLGPLVIDNVVFYQPSVGSDVRTIGYTFELDGYKSDDVTIFSPHLFQGFRITSWAYCQEPRSTIWAARDDGKLLCFTWEQEQQVWGWTLCETDGLVESVCAISENGEDRLYLIVARTIGGATRKFIERMASAIWEAVEDCCFLDCAVSFAFAEPSATLSGLDHLEGKSVQALYDGNVAEGLTVTDGMVTLPAAASKATVGLAYDSLIETLPLAMQTDAGWTIARASSVGDIVVKVVKTRGLQAGPNEAVLAEIKPRRDEAYGEPEALATGDLQLATMAVTEDVARVVVKSSMPLPFTITAIAFDPQTGG